MRRSSCVAVILLLGLGIIPATLSAQQPGGSTSGNRGAPSKLGSNYPNPFNPTTTIPFKLESDDVANGGARVTIRIYNVLQQVVAYPDADAYPGGAKPPVNSLLYTDPGSYTAFWDGKDRNGQQVASGLYYIQLIVNGRNGGIRKALVGK